MPTRSQQLIRAIVIELTADPLARVWRSVMMEAIDLTGDDVDVPSGLAAEMSAPITLRNDWSHGSWFVDHESDTTTDWSRALSCQGSSFIPCPDISDHASGPCLGNLHVCYPIYKSHSGKGNELPVTHVSLAKCTAHHIFGNSIYCCRPWRVAVRPVVKILNITTTIPGITVSRHILEVIVTSVACVGGGDSKYNSF